MSLEKERVAGPLMHQSVLKVPKALRALLLASGYEAGYVNRLTEMALDEIEKCKFVNFMSVGTIQFSVPP